MLLAMLIHIVEEDDMPALQSPPGPQWRVRRQPSPRPDGQQRWDRAYLYLMQWAHLSAPTQPMPGQEKEQEKEEDSHDGRSVCARLEPAPNAHPND